MENQESGLVCTLKSNCKSPVVLLEYDLDATATILLENGAISLDGKSTFTHSDMSIKWKHDLNQNLRMKRDVSSATSASRHTLDIDVRSQTFADASFRYALQNNGITSSISSPAAGFIGFQFTKRSPSQFYGKLFSRYLSSPDKDTDLMSFKVTLKNSEKLSIQVGYYINGLSDMLNGLKDRLPSITAALQKFLNKYHVDHFGLDLNRAAIKLKNALSSSIDRAYQEIPRVFDALQSSAEQLRQQGKKMLRRSQEGLQQIDLQDLSKRFSSRMNEHSQNFESNVRILLDAVMTFLRNTKFHLPGLEEKLTGQELYLRMKKFITKAVNRATTRLNSLMDTIADTVSDFLNKVEFTFPGTTTVISGKQILKNLKSALKSTKDQIMQARKQMEKLFQDLLNSFKANTQKAEEFLNSLKTEKLEELSSQIEGIYKEAGNLQVMQKIREWIRDAKKVLSEVKDFSKSKVQELYNGMTMENLNTHLTYLLMVLETYSNSLLMNYLELMKSVASYTEPFLKMSNKKMDIDVPLPFYWKSFVEWPSIA